jgi:hypothetical protein
LDVAKSQLVNFTRKRDKALLELKLFGQPMREQQELKLLGVTIGKQLSFKHHCGEKATKSMQRVSLLKRLSGQTWGQISEL